MEGWQPAEEATCSARGLQRPQQASHYSQAVLCMPSCPRVASCFGVRTEFEVPGIVHARPRPSMSRMAGARNKCKRHATLRLGASPRVHCLGACAVCSSAKAICAEHAPSMSSMAGARNKCKRHANFASGRLPCALFGAVRSLQPRQSYLR